MVWGESRGNNWMYNDAKAKDGNNSRPEPQAQLAMCQYNFSFRRTRFSTSRLAKKIVSKNPNARKSDCLGRRPFEKKK
jgi:hypothetical protein